MVGFELECATILGGGFLEFSPLPMGVTQIVVGFRAVGIEMEGAAIAGHGFVQPAYFSVGFAKVGMGGGIARGESRRFLNPIHGQVMATDLLGYDAEVVQRLRVSGLRREDFAVNRLCFRQPSGLMVLEGQCEGLWNRDRGQGGHSVFQRRYRRGWKGKSQPSPWPPKIPLCVLGASHSRLGA